MSDYEWHHQPGARPRRRTVTTRRQWPVLAIGTAALLVTLTGFALTTRAAQAAQSADAVNCTLVVPADPLSAQGLATPYRLLAPCHEADLGSAAFVQATAVDPATGQVSVYAPLVLDDGTRPAAQPVVPQLPAAAVVGVWFGFNGDNLTLRSAAGGDSLGQGHCVNGARNSIFGQFAYCNAPAFFTAANAAIAAGTLAVPPPGTARDGQPCPTTRDFGLVDMDPSDNVTTTYLVLPDGTTAQNTAANRSALAGRGARIQVNGSDNGLLDAYLDPALGCTPYTAPDLTDPGTRGTALALNELQAAQYQPAPVALVPLTDPMVQVGGRPDVAKANLYRAGVDQPPVDTAAETGTAYCTNLASIGVTRTQLDRPLTRQAASPDPEAADSLFTFLAQRLHDAYDGLRCPTLLNRRNPVTVATDGRGIAVDARFTAVPPPSVGPSASGSASVSASASVSVSASVGASASDSAAASAAASPSASASAPGAPPGDVSPQPPASPPVGVSPPTASSSPAATATVTASPSPAPTSPPSTAKPGPSSTRPQPTASRLRPQASRSMPVMMEAQPVPQASVAAAQPVAGASGDPSPSGSGGPAPSGSGDPTPSASSNPAGEPAIPVSPMRQNRPVAAGLPVTGAAVGPVLLVGGGMLLLGVILYVVSSRIRRT